MKKAVEEEGAVECANLALDIIFHLSLVEVVDHVRLVRALEGLLEGIEEDAAKFLCACGNREHTAELCDSCALRCVHMST
jgi:hypothetical protein